jgi:valyl-tRNA synthetase
MTRFRSIDPSTLPQHFEAAAIEHKLDRAWEAAKLQHWDPARPRAETFVVDTPPPTVSGSLHVGHVFSFTHTDVIVRQRRMLGMNIFYPMGWDDNGLPTERRVQNYFHVRCDPTLPYEAGLAIEPAGDVDRKNEGKKVPPRIVSRKNFIELCHRVTAADEAAFEQLFRRIGLSVDWRQTYATIDDRCRHLAQLSFLDLFARGHAYTLEAPTMWDVDYQTALAQADLKDEVRPGAFHDLRFAVDGGGSFVISTTRPELLPACVGIAAHPDDQRYAHLFGQRAITPLFGVSVPIFPSAVVDPEKGTGILMVCTFGDQTDVAWWREQKLPLRQIIGRDGRLVPVRFGDADYPSADPAAANAAYAELAGKSIAQAQRRIVEQLRGSALVGEPRPIQHAVKMYEKGDRPLEFVTTRQWFVKLLEQKAALLGSGRQIEWHPEFMGKRYANWTENLQIDWCVSRQRYFGVPIPVWYRIGADGAIDYTAPIVPAPEDLPIDPLSDVPAGFDEAQRGAPGGFSGDPDVFDTWFTSSLTPQIGSHWLLDPARHAQLFPADLRPQSHEIIRTWAFYTIAKALLHEATVPWHHVAISGWILDPDRKKMSKSVGNVVTPMGLIDEYGADSVRYWAASAGLGIDTAFDVKEIKVGKRLVTKLFNAGKFVLAQSAEDGDITCELDRAFVGKLRELVTSATQSFAAFDYATALVNVEKFFWQSFTDSYIELAKTRARSEADPAGRGSAVATLRLGLSVLLRLFAPMLPYVTEEVWSWAFADETGHPSIHRAPWPTLAELEAIAPPADAESLTTAIAALGAINKGKTERGASVGRQVDRLELRSTEAQLAQLGPVLADVLACARVREHHAVVAAIEGFDVAVMELAPKADTPSA